MSCTVEGCSGPVEARGWCKKHHTRWLRHGNTDGRGTPHGLSIEERFWAKVQRSPGCWLWIASTNEHGYGQFKVSATEITRAHRFSYQLAFGPIPEGMVICHHCDVPACVRQSHLFLGTQLDNIADMHAKGRAVIFGRAVA